MLKQSKARLIFFDNESGVTLMEALIAVGILSVVAVAFLSALATGFQGTILADERTVAESLTRTQLEAIRNAIYDNTPPYQYDKIANIPNGYDINISVLPINPETGDISFTDTGFQKITIVIFHGSKQVLQVETYKGSK